MNQIDCPINFNKLTKEYDTKNLTVLYREKKGKGFSGVCYGRPSSVKRKRFGKWLKQPFIILSSGQNVYPYTGRDLYKVEFTAQTKEELILFIFWHEFQHYLDKKTGVKTKHREVSEIAYTKVWKDVVK